MRSPKAVVTCFVVCVIVGVVVPVIAMYVYDPLMLFHKPWGRSLTFHKNMRHQAAGVIRNFAFDSVIIGTSMLENTSSSEAGQVLGGKFVNISLSGSSGYERSIVLDYVFRKKGLLRNAVISLDGIGGTVNEKKYPLESWAFLYDSNLINDARVYTTTTAAKCLVTFSTGTECVGRGVSLDRPSAWFREEAQSRRFGGIENWFREKNNRRLRVALKNVVSSVQKISSGDIKPIGERRLASSIENAIQYAEKYYIRFARENPSTKFYFVFPPYSRIKYALWHRLDERAKRVHEELNRYFAKVSDELPNVMVFGFEDEEFLDEIANYKDTGHYHQDINSLMLRAMSSGDNMIRSDNVERYLELAREKANNFDLVSLGTLMERHLRDNASERKKRPPKRKKNANRLG